MKILLALVPVACLLGCSCSRSQQPAARDDEPENTPPIRAPDPRAGQETDQALCLPVVSGCGCAYVCGTSVGRNDDGTYGVVHDFLDSMIITARVARWCFDAGGVGRPAAEGQAEAGFRCLDVFEESRVCGGECVPTTEYLSCRLLDGSCTNR